MRPILLAPSDDVTDRTCGSCPFQGVTRHAVAYCRGSLDGDGQRTILAREVRTGEPLRCPACLAAEERAKVVARVEAVLAANGCDCDCDHHRDEHEDYCERCLGCRIQAAIDEPSKET